MYIFAVLEINFYFFQIWKITIDLGKTIIV